MAFPWSKLAGLLMAGLILLLAILAFSTGVFDKRVNYMLTPREPCPPRQVCIEM